MLGGLLLTQCQFSPAGVGTSFNQVRAWLGAGKLDHPITRAADGADLSSERRAESFCRSLVAPWACRHRQQVTGDQRRV